MADDVTFESPVIKTYPAPDGTRHGADRHDGSLTLSDSSSTAKTILRAGPETGVASRIGVGFGTSRTEPDVLIAGQRPGEWILLGSAAANRAVIDGLDLSGFVSVIDHTHSRALFRLTGADAASVLEKVCSLDWSDTMTPDGATASASVAKVTCDIIRADRAGIRSYLIACDRSFGQYLFDAILDAGEEFGITPVTLQESSRCRPVAPGPWRPPPP